MKKTIFLVLMALQSSVLLAQTTPYRIRLPDSTYTSILVGVTSDDTVAGAWSTTYKAHEYIVTETDMYKRYDDAAGGTSYSEVTAWGKTTGKLIPGYDIFDFIMNKLSASNTVLSIGLGDTSVAQSALKDSIVSLSKMTSTAIAYIDGGGYLGGFLEGWITHDQGGTDTLSLGTLPANAMVTNVNIWCSEAFNSDGSDEVCVGIVGTAFDEYAVDVSVATTGVKTWTAGTYAKTVDETSRAVKVLYHTSDNTNLSTGECHVLVEYVICTASP